MKFKTIITILIVIMLFCLVGCQQEELITPDGENYTKYKQKSYTSLEFFGTTSYMVLGGDFKNKEIQDKAENLWEDVQEKLRTIDNNINDQIESSDIYKFNQSKAGETLEINYYTYDLLNICKEVYNVTNGKFNPAVGHLIDLWGFTPRFTSAKYEMKQPYDRKNYQKELPNEEYINAFNSLTNFEDVKLEEKDGKFYITKPSNTVKVADKEYSMSLSLGGIGKGYAADVANKAIKEQFNFGYISIGGSSINLNKSIKQYGDKPLQWQVGIGHPRGKNQIYMNIFMMDKALSTSGDYERFYTINKRRYCHIINSDGYPTNTGIMTSTIVGDKSAICDALTTAVCCMSKDEAIEFMNSKYVLDNNLRVYFVVDDEIHTNSELELVEKSYKIIK